jgi:HD-like signal output (HDOD) protein
MLAELKKTPPPPRAFHQLVSPDFVAKASSAELAELVIGVPLAATKVLARVNSAFYGLQRPVGSVGQAITYLGLNSVRSICLQYMVDASFKAHTPELRQRFDQIWAASAIAGELSHKLAQRLQLLEAGGLVTEVALSSLGHFAAATLMPRVGAAASSQTLLARAWSEQAQLGAPAAEIGALLMRAWALPEIMVEDVRAIDRTLVTTAGQLEPQRRLRLAVGYLSARLGERLARGEAVNLSDFEHSVTAGDDFFHLRAGLQAKQLQDLRALSPNPFRQSSAWRKSTPSDRSLRYRCVRSMPTRFASWPTFPLHSCSCCVR